MQMIITYSYASNTALNWQLIVIKGPKVFMSVVSFRGRIKVCLKYLFLNFKLNAEYLSFAITFPYGCIPVSKSYCEGNII